jgi:segregation and condensation protein B
VIELPGILEALLFLCPDPTPAAALADAVGIEEDEAVEALRALAASLDEDGRGLVLRELAGGWQLASHPEAEEAARRLLARPRTPPLTPAQAETLAIVAYLQPVSRPEIARIRGVNAESAAQTLIERGMIEEAGRSQFGAVLYRTTDLFLRLFGLPDLKALPDVTAWDPTPEVAANIRDRLLRAGEARLGVPAAAAPAEGREDDADAPAEPEPEPAPVIPIA